MLYTTARLATAAPDRTVATLLTQPDAAGAGDGRGVLTLAGGRCLVVPGEAHLDLIARAAGSRAIGDLQTAVAERLPDLAPADLAWVPLVRPATLDDDAALHALDDLAWIPGTGIPSTRDTTRTGYFSERRRPEEHRVAELGGEIVGSLAVHPKTRFPETAHVFAISGLMVSAGARRLGVGSALLAAAEQLARERGGTKLSLYVLGSNTGARALYERCGYVVEGRSIGDFFIDGEYVDDITLAKQLVP